MELYVHNANQLMIVLHTVSRTITTKFHKFNVQHCKVCFVSVTQMSMNARTTTHAVHHGLIVTTPLEATTVPVNVINNVDLESTLSE